MPATKSVFKEESIHKHNFKQGRNYGIFVCDYPNCREIAMTEEEYQRRCDEWNNYYQLCNQSEAHADFMEMRDAFMSHNKPRMKEIQERVKARKDANEYLERPNFFDPTGMRIEII